MAFTCYNSLWKAASLATVFYLLCIPTPVGRCADPDSSNVGASKAKQLAVEYVEKFLSRLSLDAAQQRTDSVSDEEARKHFNLSRISGYDSLDANRQKAAESVVVSNLQPFREQLTDFDGRQQQELSRLKGEWIELRADRNRLEIQSAELVAHRTAAGKLASLLSLDNRWFWLSSVLTLATLAAVSLHERRHEYRRQLFGVKAREMGILHVLQFLLIGAVGFTVITFLFGNSIYRYLTDIPDRNGRSLAAMEKEIKSLDEELRQLEQSGSGQKASSGSSKRDAAAAGQNVVGQWQRTKDQLNHIRITLVNKEHVIQQMQLDLDRLRALEEEHRSNSLEIARLQTSKAWIRFLTSVSLLGVGGFSAILLLGSIRRRREKNANTCLMCLGVGTLDSETGTSSGNGRGVEYIRCTNTISENPHEECNFHFPALYRDMPKVCFPTLGHPQSGKTHWLGMTYWELSHGNYRSKVQFEKVRSDGSENFDQIVDQILNSRMNPGRTQTDRFPHPVLFNFQDQDRFGKSNVLVSIFDYSGEVTERMTLQDAQRRRALDADGYLFFLDPTKRSGEQIKELNDFREDVRVIRKIRSGKAIDAPVALCVPKIDLLVNESYADRNGQGAVSQFYSALREIDPSGEGVSLPIIEARSRLMQQLRDTIWPGWQIEHQIAGLFGGRYMFFPLTPVGLTELGERGLKNRTVEPYGILEPVMWLLHMNGYPVLH